MKKNLLDISNLKVYIKENKIIDNLNLKINSGETHLLMGPNGAGKSTLANILIGNNKEYTIDGSIIYNEINLFTLSQEDIALNGIFLSFQHPIEIPGVSNLQFFKTFINNKRKYLNLKQKENNEIISEIKEKMKKLNLKEEFLNRGVNEGFSGGEKKKNEMLQMLMLDPKLIILDEIDSGLDIDSIKSVFEIINSFKNEEKAFLIITHYNKILEYTDVNFVHILFDGTIIKNGDKSIAKEIEKTGYFIKKK